MSERPFQPPGPGAWSLDTTHMSKPLTAYSGAAARYGLPKGIREGTARYGLFLSHLQPEQVHGFIYMKDVVIGAPESATAPPPKLVLQILSRLHPEMRRRTRACEKAWAEKLWLQDLKLWNDEIKPDSIRRNQEIQAIDPADLDADGLVRHLELCWQNLREMFYRHHKFTIASIIPMGNYLAKVVPWTGLEPGVALTSLRGGSPISRGAAAGELATLCDLLKQKGITPDGLGDGDDPTAALGALARESEEIGAALDAYLDIVGHVTTTGYCIGERYGLEAPRMLLQNIRATLATPDHGRIPDTPVDDQVREKVPAPFREEYDNLLAEARRMSPLRDERGLFNDLWATGLSRRAILTAGRRLHERGILNDPLNLLDATHEGMLALLEAEGTTRTKPTDRELANDRAWRESKTILDAPEWLGAEPGPPPPAEWLPVGARPGAREVAAALANVFDPPPSPPTETIKGMSVSPGTYEGTARIIHGSADFDRLEKGDVLVTRNTSAAFNIVLPLLGAIVTDRGGVLSHAAIVAREYGIPGIVSTRDATARIKDGSRVRIDGSLGTVECLA